MTTIEMECQECEGEGGECSTCHGTGSLLAALSATVKATAPRRTLEWQEWFTVAELAAIERDADTMSMRQLKYYVTALCRSHRALLAYDAEMRA